MEITKFKFNNKFEVIEIKNNNNLYESSQQSVEVLFQLNAESSINIDYKIKLLNDYFKSRMESRLTASKSKVLRMKYDDNGLGIGINIAHTKTKEEFINLKYATFLLEYPKINNLVVYDTKDRSQINKKPLNSNTNYIINSNNRINLNNLIKKEHIHQSTYNNEINRMNNNLSKSNPQEEELKEHLDMFELEDLMKDTFLVEPNIENDVSSNVKFEPGVISLIKTEITNEVNSFKLKENDRVKEPAAILKNIYK